MRDRPEAPLYRLGAGAYVLSPDGKLLLLDAEREGHRAWVSPGGGMEHGETIEGCAVRETFEETGLRVRLLRLLAVSEVWRATSLYEVAFLFLAEPEPWPQEPHPQELDGAVRFRGHAWFSRGEIASLDVPQDELYLRAWPSEITAPVLQRFEESADGWRRLPDGWKPPVSPR